MADPQLLTSVGNSIAGIETPGQDNPYTTVGPPNPKNGDQPYGKYQMMGNNIPDWTDAAGVGRLTPQQFLANPDAQEKTFQHRMGGYLDSHNGDVRDAASMWHSGVPYERAARENRQDVLGTKTTDYADRVASEVGSGGGGGSTATPDATTPPSVDPQTVLNDTKFWALQPDDRLNVMRRIDPRFSALAAEDQQAVLAHFQPPDAAAAPTATAKGPIDTLISGAGAQIEGHEKDLDTAGRAINTALGMPEDHWTGQYTARIGKNATNALRDFFDGAENITHPKDLGDALGSLVKLLHPLALPGEMATDLVWKAANDSGFAARHPDLAAALTVGAGILGGAMTPVPGLGRAGEEVASEAVTAAHTAEPEAAAAAKAVAGAAPGSAEATAAPATAREALAPSGTTTSDVGPGVKAALTQRTEELTKGTGDIYDAYVKAHADETVAPEVADALAKTINETERRVGGFRGAAGDVFETIRDRLRGFLPGADAPPYTVGALNDIKTQLDAMMPAVAKTAVGKDMNQLRLQVRNALRSGATGEEAQWLDTADTLWRDELRGAGMTETSLGSLTKLIKKTDPTAVVDRLLGDGVSDKQGAMATAVFKHLDVNAPETASSLREAVLNRAVTDAEKSSDFAGTLLKNYDSYSPTFKKAISNPGADAFFTVLRDELARGAGQPVAPGRAANIAAYGLKFGALGAAEAVGRHLGLPGMSVPAGMAEMLIPNNVLAKFLANSKTAALLARALKTPANSAMVPTIIQQIRDSDLGKQLLTAPEGQQPEAVNVAA